MSSRAAFRSAVYVLPRRGDEILMMRRYNTGFGDGYFSFIAGHVEAREFARACAVREAAEEAGIGVQPDDLDFRHVMHRHTVDGLVYMDFFFVIDCWQGEPGIMEPHRCDGICWTPIDDLPAKTLPYIRYAVDQIFRRQSPFSEFQSRALDP